MNANTTHINDKTTGLFYEKESFRCVWSVRGRRFNKEDLADSEKSRNFAKLTRSEIMAKIIVQNTEISIVTHNNEDYISLTDMAKSQLQEHIIFHWLSLKSTIEYLGEWEMLYNPVFNCTEFGTINMHIGTSPTTLGYGLAPNSN